MCLISNGKSRKDNNYNKQHPKYTNEVDKLLKPKEKNGVLTKGGG